MVYKNTGINGLQTYSNFICKFSKQKFYFRIDVNTKLFLAWLRLFVHFIRHRPWPVTDITKYPCFCLGNRWQSSLMYYITHMQVMYIAKRSTFCCVTTTYTMGLMPNSTIRGPFYKYGLTLIPAWISNYIHYNVWDEITYPFLNFSGATVGV